MKVALVRYNAGNYRSVLCALSRLGVEATVTDDIKELQSADKVIFPGVGEASSTMAALRESGLDKVIRSLTQPVLGVCLGMQLFFSGSQENSTTCMDIIPGQVVRFQGDLKVPHMGWNRLEGLSGPLFQGLPADPLVYFVHSYFAPVDDFTVATTEYGGRFSAAVQWKNFSAVQFHPEKSGVVGERILHNFLKI